MSERGTTQIASSNDVARGTVLNGMFEIDEKLASGGMGEVYRGHNVVTGDPVAIKVVLRELAKDETITELFFKEARILNSLHHPAIVRYSVFSIDPIINRAYLVMEYIDGPSLANVVDGHPMDTGQAMSLVSRLASGLDTAHRAGVIHRDLSPDNVILANGNVMDAKIIDFGIARAGNLDTGTLLGGKFAGKYNFVSPEQLGLFGGVITGASDVYSLGLLAANAVLGRPIAMDGTQYEIIEKRRAIPNLSGVDPELRPVLERMLEPDPAARNISMLEIAGLMAATSSRPGSFPNEGSPIGVSEPTRIKNAAYEAFDEPKAQKLSASPDPSSDQDADPLAAIPVIVGSSRGNMHDDNVTGTPIPARPIGRGKVFLLAALLVSITGTGTGIGLHLLFGGHQGLEPVANTPPPERPHISESNVSPVPDNGAHPPSVEAKIKPEVQPQDRKTQDVTPKQAPLGTPTETQRADQPIKDAGVQDRTEPIEHVKPPASKSPAELPSAPGSGSNPLPEPPTDSPPPNPPKKAANDAGGNVAEIKPPVNPKPATPPVSKAEQQLDWVKSFNGGPCFLAQASTSPKHTIAIETIGSNPVVFEHLYAEFTRTFASEPNLHGQSITASQCGLVSFLQTMARPAILKVDLESYNLKSGDALRGKVSGLSGRPLALYLIDDGGVVFPLSAESSGNTDDNRFEVGPLQIQSRQALPQLVLALAPVDPEDPVLRGVSTSDQLFRALSETSEAGISRSGKFNGDFGFAYLTLTGE